MMQTSRAARGLLSLILVASCGRSQAAVVDPFLPPAEALIPLTGDEPRYLAFRVFQGGIDPSIAFDRVMVYTPKEKIAAVVDDIVATISVTGGARAKLAVVIGPISFDHTDDEVQQIIDDGFGPNRPPADIGAEITSIVQEFVGLWTSGLAQAGIDRNRIYTHVAFVSRRQFATLPAPAGVTYEMVLDLAPSSQRPAVAFDANSRPGFTTYPTHGLFDQIAEERASRGSSAWASSEGTTVIPGEAVGSSQMSMETYLAKSFNHGATLVTLFSWGLGGPSVKMTNPFRVVTEGPDALAAYAKFLRQ